LLLLDGQVHPDTHVIPMGNYVIRVGNYVSVTRSDVGNYVSTDTRPGTRGEVPADLAGSLRGARGPSGLYEHEQGCREGT
jgi:hypothetical protein